MSPPAPAPPAILAYLTLANKLSVSWDTIHYMKPPSATPPCLAANTSSQEWDAEWMRGLHLADTTKPLGAAFSGAFIPGSLEGVWEGLFTVSKLLSRSAETCYLTERTSLFSTPNSRRTRPCSPALRRQFFNAVSSRTTPICGRSASTTSTRRTSQTRPTSGPYPQATRYGRTSPTARRSQRVPNAFR